MAHLGRLVSPTFVGEHTQTLDEQLLEHLLSRCRLLHSLTDLTLDTGDVFLGQFVELLPVHDPVSRKDSLATVAEESPVVALAVVVVQEQLDSRAIPAALSKHLLPDGMATLSELIDPVGEQLPWFGESYFFPKEVFDFLQSSEVRSPRLVWLVITPTATRLLLAVKIENCFLVP